MTIRKNLKFSTKGCFTYKRILYHHFQVPLPNGCKPLILIKLGSEDHRRIERLFKIFKISHFQE